MADDTPRDAKSPHQKRPDDIDNPTPGVYVPGQRVVKGKAGHIMTIVRVNEKDGRLWCEWQDKHGRVGAFFDAKELNHAKPNRFDVK